MNSLSKHLSAASVLATCLVAGPAAADAVSFCAAGDECTTFYVENSASATVLSVNITQEQGDSSCEGGLKKTVTRDLAGGTSLDPGQSFKVSANKICKYKVVYKTTSGCTGDKTTHIGSSDFANAFNVVKLQNACGTLKAKISRNKSISE